MSERRDHTDELNDAPELRKLGRKNPFQVPDSYLEELEGTVKDEFWKGDPQSEVLEGIGKINVFKTPERYFEGVGEAFEKSKNSGQQKSTRRFKISPLYYVAGIAAAIVLLFLFFKPDVFQASLPELEFAEIEELSMEDLLAEVKPEELSEDMILATFDQEGWGEWMEQEAEGTEMIEPEEEEMDDLLDEMDVYSLEEELDNLN